MLAGWLHCEMALLVVVGHPRIPIQTVHKTLDGEDRTVVVRFSVRSGYEETWGRVIISTTDVTREREAVETMRKRGFCGGSLSKQYSDYRFGWKNRICKSFIFMGDGICQRRSVGRQTHVFWNRGRTLESLSRSLGDNHQRRYLGAGNYYKEKLVIGMGNMQAFLLLKTTKRKWWVW